MTETKRPWVFKPSGVPDQSIITADGHKEEDNSGWAICSLHGLDAIENGLLIVRAVNSHDKLVRALELFVDCWKGGDGGASSVEELAWAFEQAEAALREAKGE